MKLIVDISDNLYNVIKSDEYGLHKGKMYDIIRNGIPLDTIKGEISKEYAETHHIFLNYASGLDAALRIIDKCISEESEEV